MDCFKRSIQLALKGCGVNSSLDFIPTPTPEAFVFDICSRLGLDIYQNVSYSYSNRPVLVGYYLGESPSLVKVEYGAANSHMVFCSDIQPFTGFPIRIVVGGWERLNAKRIKEVLNSMTTTNLVYSFLTGKYIARDNPYFTDKVIRTNLDPKYAAELANEMNERLSTADTVSNEGWFRWLTR